MLTKFPSLEYFILKHEDKFCFPDQKRILENYSVYSPNFLVGNSHQEIFEFHEQNESSILVVRDFRTREGSKIDNSIKTITCQYLSMWQSALETISL